MESFFGFDVEDCEEEEVVEEVEGVEELEFVCCCCCWFPWEGAAALVGGWVDLGVCRGEVGAVVWLDWGGWELMGAAGGTDFVEFATRLAQEDRTGAAEVEGVDEVEVDGVDDVVDEVVSSFFVPFRSTSESLQHTSPSTSSQSTEVPAKTST